MYQKTTNSLPHGIALGFALVLAERTETERAAHKQKGQKQKRQHPLERGV